MNDRSLGIRVALHDRCLNCGSSVAFVDRGPAPTYRRLSCDGCECARGRVGKELRDFLEKFVRQFGWPDQPIVLRTGKVWSPEPREVAAKSKLKRKRKRKSKMRITELFPSKYLKAADLEKPIVVTIANVTHETFKDDGRDVIKAVLSFKEKGISPVVVNKTNFGTLISITGQDDDDMWVGHKIELRSQKVMGPGGKVVDSIRVHEAPRPKKPLKEELNDEVGF